MDILFVLRKSRYNKLNEATIYCRITLNSKRAGGDFSTFLKVDPDKWDSKAQVIVSRSPEAKVDNETLSNIRITLKEIYNDLGRKQKPISADIIKREYLKGISPTITFLEAFKRLIDQKKGKKQKSNTIRSNKSRYNNVERFLQSIKCTQLIPEEFDEKIADKFEMWLRTNLDKCGHDHAMKHLQLCKQVLKYCVRQKYILHNPLQYFALHFDKPKFPVFLTLEELERMENYKFANSTLQQTADMYIFNCYTGFAYADYINFHSDEHIKRDSNADWIYQNRQKSNEIAILPFFEKAKQLQIKYNGNMSKFANQTYNKYLKEIAVILNINKRLTTHTARKTAAMQWLNAGVPEETVAQMLGQNTTQNLRRYARILPSRIAEDTKMLNK